MPVKKPSKILGRTFKLKHMKGAVSRGRATPVADLNVTPMVDMLTMLVIFLLMTFSATGEILFVTNDIVLPSAFHGTGLERAPVINVSKNSVGFEGQFVMNTADINESSYPDWKLTPLYTLLDTERENWAAAHLGSNFKGEVIIQSDNEVNFSILKLIMATCAKAKYINMNFAIQQVGKSEAALGD